MDVVALLDKIEEMISGGARIPLTNKIVLDEDNLYSVLDDLRASIPEELKQAKLMVRERERLLEEAKRESESAIAEARVRAQKLSEESYLVDEARRQANELIEKARAVAAEISDGAKRYANDVLEGLLGNLDRIQTAVREGQNEIKSTMTGANGLQRSKAL